MAIDGVPIFSTTNLTKFRGVELIRGEYGRETEK